MPVTPLPLIRGSMLLPFVKELRTRGRDPEKLLRACFCPISTDFNEPDCIIPTSRLWQLVEQSAREFRDIDFGWNTAMNHGVYGGGRLAYEWENQEKLEDAIRLYAESLSDFANASEGKVQDAGSEVWFLRGTVPKKGSPFSQVEQYAVGTMLHIVRCYLGEDWQPAQIRLVSQSPGNGRLEIAQNCKELVFSAERAGIQIPKRLLNEARKPHSNRLKKVGRPYSPFPRTLSQALIQVLMFYVPDYKLSLKSVSEILEMHTRTLDRKLAVENVNYRGVRNQVMCIWAKSRLADNHLSIAEISSALGFAYQSAFSRAFCGWAGESPQSFRRRHCS